MLSDEIAIFLSVIIIIIFLAFAAVIIIPIITIIVGIIQTIKNKKQPDSNIRQDPKIIEETRKKRNVGIVIIIAGIFLLARALLLIADIMSYR